MRNNNTGTGRKKDPREQKIVLGLMPFWTPLIPPLGISCIKAYVKKHGFRSVKTVDANVEMEMREIYERYFSTLKEYISEFRRSNFYSIGNEVWQNHMMAHLNHTDKVAYGELVKTLVRTIFFTALEDRQVEQLHGVIAENYRRLEKYVLRLLEKEKPDVLALAVHIGTLPASMFAFRLAKSKYPHIRTVMGGGVFYDQLSVGTGNLERFLGLTKDYIDTLLVGEGEVLFLRYLEGKLPEGKRVYTQDDIKGQVVDLSQEQVPDFSDFDIRRYPYISTYGSRSCPYRCAFCSDSVFWGKYRRKNPRQMARELISLFHRHNHQLFYMSDLLMNPFVTRLAEAVIQEGVSIYWDGFLKVSPEVCDPEKTLLWRRGGLYRVGIGNESGSQRVLDLMDKRITVEQSKTAISSLAGAGIKTTTFWLIGYPGETEEDFQMTLDVLEEMRDDIYYAEGNVFWSILEGRTRSEEWLEKGSDLYPEEYKEMLIIHSKTMDTQPNREERYHRMSRFIQHCKKLGIYNSYSWDGLYKADERWKKLHENAVPAIAEFGKRDVYIDENQRIKKLYNAQDTLQDDGDWGF
jgi:hypothetical protein